MGGEGKCEERASYRACKCEPQQAFKMAGKKLTRVRVGAVQGFLEVYVQHLDEHISEGGQAGVYKHLQGMDVEGKKTYSTVYPG